LNEVGLGDSWRYTRYSLGGNCRPLTQRECRDLFYNAANIRKRLGDIEGMKKMRFGARCVSGDSRKRHDI